MTYSIDRLSRAYSRHTFRATPRYAMPKIDQSSYTDNEYRAVLSSLDDQMSWDADLAEYERFLLDEERH